MIVVGLVALLVGSIAGVISINQQQKFFENIYFEKGQSIAHSLDASISNKDLQDVINLKGSLFKFLLLNPDTLEITIYLSKKGALVPLVSTTEIGLVHQDKEFHLKTFNTNRIGFHKEFEPHYNQNVLDVTAPLNISGKVIGVYNIMISLEGFDNTIKIQAQNLITLAVLAVFLFVIGISILVRFVISKPLGKLVRLTENIEKGNFNLIEQKWTNDEIGDLGRAYYKMAKKLEYSYGELKKRVEEKTQRLNQILETTERQNKNLEQTKSAMVNLLEDSRDLEEELKKEKESVEKKVIERTDQLNSEKTKLIASISGLPTGFIMTDNSHNILFVNNKALAILEAQKDNLKVFDDVLNLFPKDSVIFKLHEEYHKEKVLSAKRTEIEFRSKILKISFFPIMEKIDERNEVLGSIILVDDITEAKLVQRSKDEFFSIASHELRTPLTAIRGNADLINQYFGDQIKDPQLKEMINDIHESSVRLISIVNDFLETSRLELHKMEFKKEDVIMADMIEKTIQEFQVTGSRSKLYLEFEKPTEKIPKVLADRDRIKQILINLIGNGFKCTEKGGIKILLSIENNSVKVSVVDTGRGISKEGQKLLFRKFQQTGESLYTRDTSKGTGLGLYISRLMAEGMGGKIWLEKSEVGKGSIFSFTLPV